MFSAKRDRSAALKFFRKAIGSNGLPHTNNYPLSTKRVTLNPVAATDLQNFTDMFLNQDFISCFGVALNKHDVENIVKFDLNHWEQHKFGCWSCKDKDTSAFIGRVGLRYAEIDGVIEIGIDYAIDPAYWAQGYATEIAEFALHFGFENLKLERIVCFTLPSNIISQRLIKKLGFLYQKDIVYKKRPHVFYTLCK